MSVQPILPDLKMWNSLPCGICSMIADDDLTIVYANPFFYGLFGYSDGASLPEAFKNLHYVLDDAGFSRIHNKIQSHIEQEHTNFELEFQGRHSAGRRRWFLARCSHDLTSRGVITCVILDIQIRHTMEERLRLSVEESRIAFQLSGKTMYIYDLSTKKLYQPKSAAADFGLRTVMEHVPYSVVEAGVIFEESAEEYIQFYENMLRGIPSGSSVMRKRKANGAWCWYLSRYSLVYNKEQKPVRAVIASEDITNQYEKELVYKKWSQYFASLKENRIGYYEYNLTKNLVVEDSGDPLPPALKPFKTYTEAMLYVGEHLVYKEDIGKFYNFFDREKMLLRHYSGQGDLRLEYRRFREDGGVFWARAMVQLISDPFTGDVKIFLVTYDIDEEMTGKLALQTKSESDPLTGILNRRALIDKISAILDKRDYTTHHALLMLDIDHFKEINDTCGHQFGDLVLQDIGSVLKNSLRKTDLCGRLGGDEFVIFLYNISSDTKVENKLKKLLEELQNDYLNEEGVSGSIGLALYPRDGTTFEELYRKADTALYFAKNSGRCRYAFYQPSMESEGGPQNDDPIG